MVLKWLRVRAGVDAILWLSCASVVVRIDNDTTVVVVVDTITVVVPIVMMIMSSARLCSVDGMVAAL